MSEQAKLAMKLAGVMASVPAIPKTGRNDFHRYDYHTEADITSHIRAELAKRHVMMIPSIVDHREEQVQNGKKSYWRTTVTMRITFIDGEHGGMLVSDFVGVGEDQNDKGYYKAYTGALKYALMKTFMVTDQGSPGDPEASHPTNEPSATPQANRPKRDRSQEFKDLLKEAGVPEHVQSTFEGLYVQRMGVKSLGDIEPSKLGSMCRKLRGMSPNDRKQYIQSIADGDE